MLFADPLESVNDNYAENYAKKIAAAVYTDNKQYKLTFYIRDWLINVFEDLRGDITFVDFTGKKISNYVCDINQKTIEHQNDMAIVVITKIRVSDVPAMIKELE